MHNILKLYKYNKLKEENQMGRQWKNWSKNKKKGNHVAHKAEARQQKTHCLSISCLHYDCVRQLSKYKMQENHVGDKPKYFKIYAFIYLQSSLN